MSVDLQASVVLITSRNSKISRFGTGFVVYRDGPAIYLLTCAHVIADVGGPETIDVGGVPAAVVASGTAEGLDLAVLRVEGLPDKPLLSLRASGERGSAFITAGFQQFGRHFLVRPLQGKLGEPVGLAVRGQANRIQAWDLKIEDDYQLQPGYSGSPVVDQAGGHVLGVVSHRQGQGERGLAISIESLPKIWPDMPAGLLQFDTLPAVVLPPQTTAPDAVQTEAQGADMSQPVTLFFSYAHEDEALRDELAKHLSILRRQGIIAQWYDRDITAGSEWVNEIDKNLNSADIILLLISSDFIASDYCYDVEMKRALERHETREAVVIPVVLRPTKWGNAPFSKLQALPKNAKPVTSWTDQDEAFLNIAEGIQRVAKKLASKRAVVPPQNPSSQPPASPSYPAPSTTPATAAPPVQPQSPTTEYNTGVIRKLLKTAFADEDFTVFCYDNFREVHNQFSAGMSFIQKMQRLIEYCESRLLFEQLLRLVEQENPTQYRQFASQLKR